MTHQWTCPFCNNHQVVTDANFQSSFRKFHIGKSTKGETGLAYTATRCVNPDCNEVALSAQYVRSRSTNNGWVPEQTIEAWQLRPGSSSKPQPDYIPAALREDYFEACAIRSASPKASATLARRCLQGMIRDFCGIAKGRLIDEIKELNKRLDDGSAPRGVEPETIEAIDAVRDIGNIGAHMEKDINLIIDVEPGEAQALIELIEMLFEEWYVARHKREQRLAAVKTIAAEKKAAIATGRAQIAKAVAATPDDEGDVIEG
ncbi:DUF4145 domain-containing protein [Rhizobium phaseoli]|uniref:DUF4145 domain-containing protein n=1 Tax=Rhizobium phaseoli TaxID=396 RepID=UPI0003829C53|nr:DUF4145 domain-containing protein [Rhizobium phaseoli]KKZ89093.1 hypothetical protein RPHASCH2410_CH00425 [Rhizobium phaseoli Ch24-10]